MIPGVTCSQCGRTTAPGGTSLSEAGGTFFDFPSGRFVERTCACGSTLRIPYNPDPDALSNNIFLRWFALSNHVTHGRLDVQAGREKPVPLDPPFDVIGAAFFTPEEYFLKIVPEFKADGTEVRLATSIPTLIADGRVAVSLGQQVTVSMIIYGLRDLSGIPTWRQLFYSAMRLTKDGLWKPALLEYAISFEAFVAEYLATLLAPRFPEEISRRILKNERSIENRVKELLRLVAGYELTEAPTLFSNWQTKVQQVRNRLGHGQMDVVTPPMVEEAHQAVYQTIRWMQEHPVTS